MTRRTFRTLGAAKAWLAAHARPGTLLHLVIVHDDACPMATCQCRPDYVIEPLTAETWAAGERQQAAALSRWRS